MGRSNVIIPKDFQDKFINSNKHIYFPSMLCIQFQLIQSTQTKLFS